MPDTHIRRGTAAPLMRDFVNTDAVIPATHMRRLTKSGYADVLFEPWRGTPGFVLDDPRYAGATVLIAGEAFGSGSSREHAPWALRDGGFNVIIAVSFADIFRQNCSIVGLVPVEANREFVAALGASVVAEPTTVFEVDLNRLYVRAGDLRTSFELEPYIQRRLIKGADLVSETLEHADLIDDFEARRPTWMPRTQPNGGNR